MKKRNHILKNKILIVFLGIYQILGGTFGLVIAFKQSKVNFNAHPILYFVVFGLFCFSVYSGILVLSKKWITGLKYSYFNQLLQVVKINIIGFGYIYVAGSYLGLGFSDTPQFNIVYKYAILKASCFFWIATGSNEITIVINFIPIFLLILITYLQKQKSIFYNS